MALTGDQTKILKDAVAGLLRLTTGNVWYVQSVHTRAANNANTATGRDPSSPFATVDYAVGRCTANNGDTIYALPGHVETVSAAAALAIDVEGIAVIGIGRGQKQPKIDVTAELGTVTMTANDCVLDNFQIEASFADVASEIVVTGLDCVVRNCRFLEPVTNENALINILTGSTTTGGGLLVEECEFRGLDAANTHGIHLAGTPARVIIRNNIFEGVFESGGILSTGAVVQITIENNLINNTSGDADECILLAATSTGCVVRNLVGNSLGGNATTNINCGATCTLAENYSTDKGDVQGVLDPIAT